MYQFVYVTCPSLVVARNISKKLLLEKMIACANIIPGVESMYWWDNEIEESNEVILLMKTKETRVKSIEKLVIEEHPYENPAIIGLPMTSISKLFASFIDSEIG